MLTSSVPTTSPVMSFIRAFASDWVLMYLRATARNGFGARFQLLTRLSNRSR